MTSKPDELYPFPETRNISPAVILEVDLLIGRLLDDEAAEEDRARFEQLANLEPAIWRRYARAQEDACRLAAAFDRMTESALSMDLPAAPVSPRPLLYSRIRAYSGWAAMLALVGVVATWSVRNMRSPGLDNSPYAQLSGSLLSRPVPAEAEELRAYLNQSSVVGQLEPVVLGVEEMSDGRLAIRFIRLIEESILIDAPRGGESEAELIRYIHKIKDVPLRSYLEEGDKTGFLFTEHEPVILGAREQPGGTLQVRFIRRLEEVSFVPDVTASASRRTSRGS